MQPRQTAINSQPNSSGLFYYSKKPIALLESAVETTATKCPVPFCEIPVCVIGTPITLLVACICLLADCNTYNKRNSEEELSEYTPLQRQQMG